MATEYPRRVVLAAALRRAGIRGVKDLDAFLERHAGRVITLPDGRPLRLTRVGVDAAGETVWQFVEETH